MEKVKRVNLLKYCCVNKDTACHFQFSVTEGRIVNVPSLFLFQEFCFVSTVWMILFATMLSASLIISPRDPISAMLTFLKLITTAQNQLGSCICEGRVCATLCFLMFFFFYIVDLWFSDSLSYCRSAILW